MKGEGVAVLALLGLSGCGEQVRDHYAHLTTVREQRELDAAYERCLFEAKGYFGTASIEVMKHCEDRHLLEGADNAEG